MGRFATGKYAVGISDRSGMKYRLQDMKMEWNGSLVGPDEFERTIHVRVTRVWIFL